MALVLVYTDAAKARIAELMADKVGVYSSNPLEIKEFKIGTGNTDANGDPNPPLSSRTALDIAKFTKTLTAGELSHDSAGTLTITCSVGTGEGNDTPDPEYTEIGVFDMDDRMIIYGTYGPETKTAAIPFNFTLTVPI